MCVIDTLEIIAKFSSISLMIMTIYVFAEKKTDVQCCLGIEKGKNIWFIVFFCFKKHIEHKNDVAVYKNVLNKHI